MKAYTNRIGRMPGDYYLYKMLSGKEKNQLYRSYRLLVSSDKVDAELIKSPLLDAEYWSLPRLLLE